MLTIASQCQADDKITQATSTPRSLASPIKIASVENAKLPALANNITSGPYCGINSLFVCLRALHVEVQPAQLIAPQYIGSSSGSSASELVDAASAFGARAECLSNLGHHDLTSAVTPMILHVKDNSGGREYSHWIAFLGCDGSTCRLVDLPHEIQDVPLATLLANWDGNAIAISKDSGPSLLTDARSNMLLSCALFFVSTATLLHLGQNVVMPHFEIARCSSYRRAILEAGVIVGVSSLMALAVHLVSEVGFLRSSEAVAEVARRYFDAPDLHISLADLKTAMTEEGVVLLDARFRFDYERGSLPGARSMSIDSTLTERQFTLMKVPKSARIVVFCQSARCHFSDDIANFLAFNGYENVHIYRNGYEEWARTQFDVTSSN